MTPEAQVVKALLRARYGGEERPSFGNVSGDAWDAVPEQAVRWRVAPLLYDTVRRLGDRAEVPTAAVERLRRAYLDCAAENSRTFHRLGRILALLRERKIPTIVLKGSHLAGEVYGNVALRPMCDVDLLVRGADARAAQKALVDSGYRPRGDTGFRIDTASSAHLPTLVRDRWPPVEIHWSLSAPSVGLRPDIDGLWERAGSVPIGTEHPLGLSPEDLLVHIAFHAGAHKYAEGPLFLCDVAELFRRFAGRIDGNRAVRLAAEWGASKALYLAVRLAGDCLGANVPPGEFEAGRPPGIDEETYLGLKARVFGEPHDAPGIVSRLGPASGWRRAEEFARSLVRAGLLPREAMHVMYDVPAESRGVYLYYPVRWVELLVRHGFLRDGAWLPPSKRRV